jgi:hypothetical protein
VNQWHSCAIIDIDFHFRNKPEHIEKTYGKLIASIRKIGRFETNCVKSAIFLKTATTYLEIKPKKDFLLIGFYLDKEVKEFPIFKTVKLSENRIVHEIRLHHPREINAKVISLLKESYKLINPEKRSK